MNDPDARKALRFAIETLWVQHQTIFSLMNALHAMENLLRRDHPEMFAQYDAMKTETTSLSYPEQRAIIEEIEKVMEFARKIAPHSSAT